MGAIPYGYDITEDGAFMVVPEEAEIIREILENISGGSTLYAEAKRLNNEGVSSPGLRFKGKGRRHGTSWPPSTVGRIVAQRAYAGVHEVALEGGRSLSAPSPPSSPRPSRSAPLRHSRRTSATPEGGAPPRAASTCCAASCGARSVV